MRITFVLPPVGLSGGIRVLAIYANSLQRCGHQVTIVSPPHRKPPLLRSTARWLRGRGWPPSPKPALQLLDGTAVEHRVLERYRPIKAADVPDADVVLATWWETAPWVHALPANKGAKAYFVQDYGAVGQPLVKLVETWRLPLHMFTISRFLQDLIREHTGKHVESVGNGVDMGHFAQSPRERNADVAVGLVYRALPEKGCAAALEAVQRAREAVPGLRLRGFGGRRPEPCPPALDEGGFQWGAPDAMLPGIYASCDAWLFASQREGYGLPILEAMAARTPVIATPAGAAPELIEGGGGILVDHGDVTAMAEAIVSIATMSLGEWRAMSDAAHRTANEHSWEKATERFEAALLHACR